MQAEYYSIRQLNPYRGLTQVVDLGDARGYSFDGARWQVRCRNQFGQHWTIGIWSDDESHLAVDTPATRNLSDALRDRPDLPFTRDDTLELWLLDKKTFAPLALLRSARRNEVPPAVADQEWRAFMLEDNRFVAASLAEIDAARPAKAWPVRHRDVLERLINGAARPLPAAQWFQREADGSGVGMNGLRLDETLIGRALEPRAFPELILRERWERDADARLVREYHDWNAAMLLTHEGLSARTRKTLERAACNDPRKLLHVFRLIPQFVDRAALDIALVQARLMETG